jgi:hypothetical protein
VLPFRLSFVGKAVVHALSNTSNQLWVPMGAAGQWLTARLTCSCFDHQAGSVDLHGVVELTHDHKFDAKQQQQQQQQQQRHEHKQQQQQQQQQPHGGSLGKQYARLFNIPRQMELGVYASRGAGKFHRTKIITIAPACIVINRVPGTMVLLKSTEVRRVVWWW